MPRFFVINPIDDRRTERRFESQEPIKIRLHKTGDTLTGAAFDIGHYGLRLETKRLFEVGERLQIEFEHRANNIGCFAQVAWAEAGSNGLPSQCGVAIESWYGIVEGKESWQRVKGVKPKKDRRQKTR